MKKFFRCCLFGAFTFLLGACEQAGFSLLNNSTAASMDHGGSSETLEDLRPVLELGVLIDRSSPKVNVDAGFAKAMQQAVDQDPAVIAAKNEALASKARLRLTRSGRDTKINATVLGGIEDITDETMGVAAIIKANRMLYDGGILEASINADNFYVQAAEQAYLATRGERALGLANAWIDLEHYQSLSELIKSRLAVLDPLLVQLERVATAGVGDVSQVASAERIVSSILVAEQGVTERYAQARIVFLSGFGRMPIKAKYNSQWVSKSVPSLTVKKIAENSPGLLTKYWNYRAAEATVLATEARDEFSIGLEARLQRPFGGSGANSDESVGVVVTKNFYRGDQLESQVNRAKATAEAKAALVFLGYREGELAILAAREMISSMDKAITLARRNAKSSREEIEYLRKQLIIGGSTLESVLSAEARLYDAESKEIGFIAQRRKAWAKISAISGSFSKALSSD